MGVAMVLLSGLGVLLCVLVVSIFGTIFGQVHRSRVERFGLRQLLPITVTNGPVVIRYLATTRRWRGGLLAVTLALLVLYSVVERQGADISGGAAFAGWFIGAVVAEWRVSGPAFGRRFVASLRPRQISDYVARPVLVFVVLVWAAGVVGVVGAVFATSADRDAMVTLALFVVASVSLQAVTRRVLDRAQPLADPEVLAADNAIRGRSLNALAGSALAIGGYLGASAVLAWQHVGDSATNGPTAVVGVIGYLFLPILGVIVAKGSHRRPSTERAGQLAA